MPEVTDVERFVKDSAYAAIGFGVLSFQRAQVRRRELLEQLGELSRPGAPGAGLGAAAKQLESLGAQLQAQVEQLQSQLAAQVDQLRSATAGTEPLESVRSSVREAVRRVDEQVQPVARQLDDRLSEVEELLPAPTRAAVRQVRSTLVAQGSTLRAALGLGA